MLTLLSSFVLASALLGAPEISVALKGAHTIACAPDSTDNADACYTATSSVPIELEVRSSDGLPTLHSIKYGIFPVETSSAVAAGQSIDVKGTSVDSTELPFPKTSSAGCGNSKGLNQTPGTYVIQIEIGDGEELRAKKLFVEILADEERSPTAWPIGDTGLHIAPKGQWRDMRASRAMPGALDLESCATHGVRIVAFTVQPNSGVSLTQYVSNSVEAYSDAATWRVSKRESSHIAAADGEHLSLEQTIAGVSVAIEKYFIDVDTRIVILSLYGMSASEAQDLATTIEPEHQPK